MRIIIDMQGVQTESKFRGIGRYIKALVGEIILNIEKDDEVYLVFNGLLNTDPESVIREYDKIINKKNILIWRGVAPAYLMDPNNLIRENISQKMMVHFISELNPDVVLISSLFEGYSDNAITNVKQLRQVASVCVIAYDLIPLIYADKYLDPDPRYKQYYENKLEELKCADLFLTISESSKKELIDIAKVGSNDIYNIGAGCDSIFRPVEMTSIECEKVKKKLGVTKPFILYTGGADERKNLGRLVSSFARLPEAIRGNYQYVFAGRLSQAERSLLTNTAKDENLELENMIFPGFISDEDLVAAYSLCALFVFPSIHEGFGLPVLEAMACGAPVVASGSTSIPEIVEWDEALFKPTDVNSMTNKILKALTNDEYRLSLKKKGLIQSRKFAWDTSAQKALYAMRSLRKSSQLKKLSTRKDKVERLVQEIARLVSESRHVDDNLLRQVAISIDLNVSKISADNTIKI